MVTVCTVVVLRRMGFVGLISGGLHGFVAQKRTFPFPVSTGITEMSPKTVGLGSDNDAMSGVEFPKYHSYGDPDDSAVAAL
jgi:hypothetical protein